MRRPGTSLAAALAAAALPAAGCGERSPSAEPQPPPPPPPTAPPTPPPPPAPPSPTFTKSDLPRIALGPKNAPSGLVYVKDESGPLTLLDAGLVLPTQTRPLRALGFEAMHDSIFVAKAQGLDQRVSQRIWLFQSRAGAMGWLKKTREDAASAPVQPS